MNRVTVSLLCGAAFVAGVCIGARGGLGPWDREAHAQPQAQPVSAVDRAYTELQTARTPLGESSELLAKISRLTTNSVVHIQSERRTRGGHRVEETGSGVIMESTKFKGPIVISNRHVVDGTDMEKISIYLHDGRVIHPTKILSEKDTDVAVIQVSATGLQPARWGDSDKVEIGHMVLAMGSPFGLSQSVTLGIISAKGRRSLKLGETSEMLNQDFLQTDAAINPGNSGGPLIDMQGQVIGINTAIASNSGGNEGIGFSIPSNLVRSIAEQLLEYGKVTRAYLGVQLDPEFNAAAAARLKLERIRGARVVLVYPNTPASRANLQKDDVVTKFDGVEVLDENHLINMVSLAPVGKRVKLEIWRDGRHMTLDLAVGDRADLPKNERSEAPAQPGSGTHFDSLGLLLHKLEPDVAAQLGFDKSAKGLLVLRVDRDSPMDGDIRLYDLIEEVAQTPVGSVAELQSALDAAADSRSVLLTVRRRQQGQSRSEVVVYRRAP